MITKIYSIFLLLTILAMPSFALPGSNKNKLSDERSEITVLDTSFRVPSNWFEGEDNFQIKHKINKMDGQKEQMDKLLASNRGNIKAYAYSKEDPSKYPGVIPTITMLIRQKQNMSYDEFVKLMEKSSRDMGRYLNNYSIVQSVKTTNISNKQIVYFIVEFDINLVDGSKKHIRNITYAIPYESTFLQVSMSEEKPVKTEELFAEFINSFEFK